MQGSIAHRHIRAAARIPRAATPDGNARVNVIAAEAVAIGAKVLWLQLGISNDEAAATALAGGLEVVLNMCMGALHRRLQIAPKA